MNSLDKKLKKGVKIMKLSISKHAKEEYIKRIKNMKFKTISDFNYYISTNSDEISEELNEIFKQSTFFYEGVVGNAKKPAKFYIKDDLILVIGRNGIDFVTIYHTSFGLGEDENGNMDIEISNRLFNQIMKLTEKLQNTEPEIEGEKEKINLEMEKIKCELELVKQRENILHDELKLLKNKLSNVTNNKMLIETSIRDKAEKLINYTLYMKALGNSKEGK